MKLKVFTVDGSSSSDKDFGLREFEGDKGLQALKDVIVAYQANIRQGSAKTKTRAEVSGTGKKPYRQKGTGHARRGSNTSPICVGGGVVFGPRPRSYNKTTNTKVRKLALARALFNKATEGKLLVIEKFDVEQPKTKLFNKVIGNIQSSGKVLVADEHFNDNTILAARNIERVGIIGADSLNAWDVVRYNTVIIGEEGLNKVIARINEQGA